MALDLSARTVWAVVNVLTQIFSAYRKGFSRKELERKDLSMDFSIKFLKNFHHTQQLEYICRAPNHQDHFPIYPFVKPVMSHQEVMPLHHTILHYVSLKLWVSCHPKENGNSRKAQAVGQKSLYYVLNLALGRSPWGLLEQEQSLPHTRPLSLLKSCTHVARPSPYSVCTYEWSLAEQYTLYTPFMTKLPVTSAVLGTEWPVTQYCGWNIVNCPLLHFALSLTIQLDAEFCGFIWEVRECPRGWDRVAPCRGADSLVAAISSASVASAPASYAALRWNVPHEGSRVLACKSKQP